MTRRNILASLTMLVVLLGSMIWTWKPASAIPVFDASNYSENLLTAARALTQINNQIQALQNQAAMLQNMATNLQRMDYSSVTQMTAALQQVDALMLQAQGISFNVNTTSSAFQQLYPAQYAAATSSNQLVLDAHSRWQTSMNSYQQTMSVQSQVVQNVQADGLLLTDLVNRSQGAAGNLEVQQATNQLLALSTKQQLQIQNMLAAQFRAAASDRASAIESQEQARAGADRCVGNGQFYPSN